jgi:hypothetical protein
VYRKGNQSKDGLDGLQEPFRRGLPKGREYEPWHLALDTVEAKLKVASEIDHLNYVADCILRGTGIDSCHWRIWLRSRRPSGMNFQKATSVRYEASPMIL